MSTSETATTLCSVNQSFRFPSESTLECVKLKFLHIRPEILIYVKMGYKLVDADGHLIPIDMTILAQILRELN